MSLIALDGVVCRHGSRTVLSGISLEIDAGEFVTVIGPSGSGKTTLLRLINGLATPSAGQVRVRGQDLATADLVALRRTVGYVIQEAGLFPHLTVQGNIGYVPSLQGARPAELRQRVHELLDVVRLEPALLTRYPHQLSGGQRQRVGIARALAARPDIMLMDEPFGAVDEITRAALQAEIRQIHARTGVTIVFVTHDIHEALTLGARVLVLHRGRVAQFGTPQQLLHHPATEDVAALVRTALQKTGLPAA
ncbi:MAG: ABC transporter ATP-binding protein [Comamonadaceae bacterium]|nr:ABC transporter ATP-binding protein [Comamonadaceae bacterium]